MTYINHVLGNIIFYGYYEDNVIQNSAIYEYDELNQLVVEEVNDHNLDCSIVRDTCYSRYYEYDFRGNITDKRTYVYGASNIEESQMNTITGWYLGSDPGYGYASTYAKFYIHYPQSIDVDATAIPVTIEGYGSAYCFEFWKMTISGHDYTFHINGAGTSATFDVPISTLEYDSVNEQYKLDWQYLYWVGCANGMSYYAPGDVEVHNQMHGGYSKQITM
ncbi:MAG: hypothetical protein KKG64_00075 [Firmicutes bacterium]|nr:hypothetical protein [Bacillota bacterium]